MNAIDEFYKMTPEDQSRFLRCTACGGPIRTTEAWQHLPRDWSPTDPERGPEQAAHEACLDELRSLLGTS